MSGPFLSAPDGEVLPPDPVIYAFETWEPTAITANVPIRVGPRETFGEMTVRRVRLSVRAGSARVRLGAREYTYAIDAGWVRGETRPTVDPFQAVESAWTCSYTDVVAIDVRSRAHVFEVRWPGGHTIVPDYPWAAFDDGRSDVQQLQLGHVSCLGRTVAGRRPRAERFEVIALYPDGTRASAVSQRAPIPVLPPLRGDSSPSRSVSYVQADPMPRGPLAALMLLGVFGVLVLIRR